jgi:Type II/IV secretion system protein
MRGQRDEAGRALWASTSASSWRNLRSRCSSPLSRGASDACAAAPASTWQRARIQASRRHPHDRPHRQRQTTTLHATLKQLATDEVNVCTVEDPIEMVEPALNQTQMQTALDLDFGAGVRARMRPV